MSEISKRVVTLAEAINFQVGENGVATGNAEAYVDNLSEGLREHGAFATLEKKVPGILASDKSNEDKADEIVEVAYKNAEETVRAVGAYNTEFFAATGLSLGEAAQAYIKEHKDVGRVTGKVKTVGRDVMTGVYDQTYSVTIQGQNGEPARSEERHGRVRVGHVVSATKPKAKGVADVYAEIAARAEAMLK